EIVAARRRHLRGEAARGRLESAGAQLQRHRAADELALGQRLPERMRLIADVVGDFLDRDVVGKCALARPRLPFSRRLDRTLLHPRLGVGLAGWAWWHVVVCPAADADMVSFGCSAFRWGFSDGQPDQ